MAGESQGPASPAAPAYPDVDAMLEASYEDFQKGAIVGGWDALRHRMRGNIYQSNPNGLQEPRLTQFRATRSRGARRCPAGQSRDH